MTLEGKIIHGVAIDCNVGQWDVRIEVGSMDITLCNAKDFDVILALGPIGTYVDLSSYYHKEEIDQMMAQKQNRLTAGKDIWITNDVIDNEHDFFSNFEIESAWNAVMNNV